MCQYSEEFHLEDDVSGFPLVLGLLSDRVSFSLLFLLIRNSKLISVQIANSKEKRAAVFRVFQSMMGDSSDALLQASQPKKGGVLER